MFQNHHHNNRRGTVLLALALAIPIATMSISLAIEVSKIHQRRVAIARIEELGGFVSFDYQWGPKGWHRDAKPPGHPWLKRILGEHYASQPVEIQLFKGNRMTPEEFTDAEAEQIAVLTEVKWLVLQDTRLTDIGLMHFNRMTMLERLDIEGTSVTKEGVAEFQRASPDVKVFYSED